MRNFKRFLREEIDTSHFLKTKKEIYDFLSETTTAFRINDDLTVDCTWHQGLLIEDDKRLLNGYFPCQYATAKNLVIKQRADLKSLVGSPIQIVQSCEINIGSASELSSLVGCPKEVGQVFKVVDFQGKIQTIEGITSSAQVYRNYLGAVSSYQNVHKEIKHIGHLIEITSEVRSNMLGFALIPSTFSIISLTDRNDPLKECLEILNSYTVQQDKDVLECKEELMENNLRDFAKL